MYVHDMPYIVSCFEAPQLSSDSIVLHGENVSTAAAQSSIIYVRVMFYKRAILQGLLEELDEDTEPQQPRASAAQTRRRLRSLDAFRGFASVTSRPGGG